MIESLLSLPLVLIFVTFLFAGSVKGAMGLGLPTISLGILTAFIDIHTAMALVIVPSFLTNVWQASAGGHMGVLIRRLWPFLLAATLPVWLGAQVVDLVDVHWLTALLGVLLLIYAMLGLTGYHFNLTPRQEPWAGPALGLANGLLTGMTGSFVFPGVMFLHAIGLTRHQLVQAMGMLFLMSTLALAVSLQDQQLLTVELGVLSLVGFAPAALGVYAGQRIRHRLSETGFKKALYLLVGLLGLYIIITALLEGLG